MELSKEIGLHIANIRKSKSISQEELAFSSKIARSYIGAVERGEKNISVLYLKKISDVLQITLFDFFKTLNYE